MLRRDRETVTTEDGSWCFIELMGNCCSVERCTKSKDMRYESLKSILMTDFHMRTEDNERFLLDQRQLCQAREDVQRSGQSSRPLAQFFSVPGKRRKKVKQHNRWLKDRCCETCLGIFHYSKAFMERELVKDGLQMSTWGLKLAQLEDRAFD